MKRAFALLFAAPLLLVALLFVHFLAEESKGVPAASTASVSVETMSVAPLDCVDGCHIATDTAEVACVFALLVGLMLLGAVAVLRAYPNRPSGASGAPGRPRPPTTNLLHVLSVSRT